MSDLDKDRANYRQTVISFLVMEHGWDEKRASNWIDHNFQYMEGMWGSSCPPQLVAHYISRMKHETDEQ